MRMGPTAILALATLVIATTAAGAQGRRRAAAPSAPAPVQYDRNPSYSPSGRRDIYATPPGYTGIIRADTPNADGNFGGPSAGGGPS